MRHILIIGQFGMGKSTLGNRLLRKNFFTTGNQPKTITEEIQIGQSNKYKIIDCPGFGDSLDQFRFFKQYLLFKKAIPKVIRSSTMIVKIVIVEVNSHSPQFINNFKNNIKTNV